MAITYKKAELAARDLLMQLNLEVPVELNEILDELQIDYQEIPLSDGIDGALLCAEGNYGILVNNTISYEARKRFTIAHELGHYWIPEHQIGGDLKCASRDIGAFDEKKSLIEYEADMFAAEFLMPKVKFAKDVQRLMPSIASIKELADKYKTSLTATAIRFIECTLEPCALVLIESKKVRWKKLAKNFKYDIKTKLSDCYAFDLAESGEECICDSLGSHFWLTNCNIEYIVEDAINFKNLNQQLVLLKFKQNKQYISEDENMEEYDYYD